MSPQKLEQRWHEPLAPRGCVVVPAGTLIQNMIARLQRRAIARTPVRLVDIEAAEILADRCMPKNCSSHAGRQTGWISPFDLREPAPTSKVGGLDKVTLGVHQLEELLATIRGIAEEQMSPRRVNFLRCPRANRVQGHNRAGCPEYEVRCEGTRSHPHGGAQRSHAGTSTKSMELPWDSANHFERRLHTTRE